MRGAARTLILISLLAGVAGTVEPQFPQPSEAQDVPYRISVNVHLVLLNVTVRDSKGRFAPGLAESNFQVYEDGVLQSIRLFRHEDIPVTVGLVIDHSASMKPKLADVVAAARTFVAGSRPADEMFVVNFNEKASAGLPDSLPFTNRPEDLANAIGNAPTLGMTALFDAVFEARTRLRAGTREKKVLIVISDGGDNASRRTLGEVLQAVRESTTLVYTVGIYDVSDPDRNLGVLRSLASATGGDAFFPGETKDVVEICEGIARDIRNQYVIGYVSNAPPQAGVYRAIRVAARTEGGRALQVRARTGYITAGEPRHAKAGGR